MRQRLFGSLTLALLFGARAIAQTPTAAIDTLFKGFAIDGSPGCAVGAIRGNSTLVARAFGRADLEHDAQLTTKSVFYMASVSKQFTALSILLLERDGRIRLDDAVRSYVPELPSYAAGITIRQLLNHTSGLRDYLTLASLAGRPTDYVITERAVLGALARQSRLNFSPGVEHLYSNSGYVLLSVIVHRVSGRPLNEFARERIFSPLGMRDTRFQHDHSVPIPDRANGYVRRGDTWRSANSLLDVVGDGGMYSTIDDMLRWASAFDRPEFAPLLARMATPSTLSDGRPIDNGYGMGLVRGTYRGLTTVSHGGSLAGYRTNLLRLPDEELTVVVLCNNASAAVGRLSTLVVEALATSRMSDVPPAASTSPTPGQAHGTIPGELGQAAAGLFYSDEIDATYRIAARSDSVTLAIGDNAPVALWMTGSGDLAGPGVVLTPLRDDTGRIVALTLGAGRVRDVMFRRRQE